MSASVLAQHLRPGDHIVVGQATSGLTPAMVLMTPVEAVRRLLDRTGWSLESVDLLELNEAFAVQAVAVMQELELDQARVNVRGGAVALGHAIGSSGSRVLTTLLFAMAQRNARRLDDFELDVVCLLIDLLRQAGSFTALEQFIKLLFVQSVVAIKPLQLGLDFWDRID